MTGLNTQQSLGNDQYPKSITKSNNVLSNHRFDITNKSNYKKPGDNDKERKQKDVGKEDEDVNLSFARLEGSKMLLLWKNRSQISFVPRQEQTQRGMGYQQGPKPCTGTG